MGRRWWSGLLAAGVAVWLGGCAHVMAYNDAVAREKDGAYGAAARKAVEAVGHARDYPEARALWGRVWERALAETLQLVGDAEGTGDWATAVRVLDELQGLVERARQLDLPTPMAPITERLTAARHQAAEVHYADGLRHETAGRLKEAAISFRTATSYVPDYKDAQARYLKDRDAAIARVAVLPFENRSGYPGVAEMLSDKLLGQLLGAQGEFVRYVDRQHLDALIKEASFQASGMVDTDTAVRLGKMAGVRYLVVGRVTQTSATTPRNSRLRQDSARLIRDASGRDIPVSCSYTKHELIHEVIVTASLQLLDVVSGQVLEATSSTERRRDSAEWIDQLYGDERALDHRTNHLRYASHYPKSHAQLIADTTDVLSRRFAKVVAGKLE